MQRRLSWQCACVGTSSTFRDSLMHAQSASCFLHLPYPNTNRLQNSLWLSLSTKRISFRSSVAYASVYGYCAHLRTITCRMASRMEIDRKRLQHDNHTEISSSYLTKRQRTLTNDLGNTIHEPQSASPSHDNYTIAWICVLHIEIAAARAILDEIHEDLPRYANDSNTYMLSSIKKHNIVIVCLPTVQYGTNNAANILMHLIRTFPSIHLGTLLSQKAELDSCHGVKAAALCHTATNVN